MGRSCCFFLRSLPVVAAALIQFTSEPAAACGGLFCSATNPVNQAAERIIFAQEGTRTTAVIEIQYEGPSEQFAWVLPVPGVPEIGVSSKQALDRLQQASNPVYSLTTTSEQCGDNPLRGPTVNSNAGGGGDGDGDPSVNVVSSGTVGPYAFNVISVSDDAENPAELALTWLADNGYDVSQLGGDILADYLEAGLNLAAFRLTKNSDAGSIRPVLISYESSQPVIPIRPTAVAANPDMGILVWVLGSGRAVPTNYRSLILNDALINWFNPGATYNDVVIAAADEAGGHGFVTEYASAGDEPGGNPFYNSILPQFELLARDELDRLSLSDLLLHAWYNFGSWDGFREVIEQSVRLRDGVTIDTFLECVDCYLAEAGVEPMASELPIAPTIDAGTSTGADGGSTDDAGGSTANGNGNSDAGNAPIFDGDPIWATDPTRFLELLDQLVIEPVRNTALLFPGHRVTRLYTTLSADEMDEDPIFDFNMTLSGVSNQHQADRFQYCDGHWVIRLPSGFVLTGSSAGSWPVSIANEIPVNLRVTQDNTDGEPELITNNRTRIANQLEELGVTSTWPPPAPKDDSGCGCRVVGNAAGATPWWMIALGAGLALRRRRR